MTSYTRARAESLIRTCKVGFMERPERIVLLIIGGLANRMEAVLWILAVLGNWTVLSRIYNTWRELPKPEELKRSHR
jgi:CDP-diacylglycerol---glycerol-3-phosphate 3-phosphatidyltransferase